MAVAQRDSLGLKPILRKCFPKKINSETIEMDCCYVFRVSEYIFAVVSNEQN